MPSADRSFTVYRGAAADLDPVLLYRLLWLRVRVFVVEQGAAYDELDGRDIEPGAELLWATECCGNDRGDQGADDGGNGFPLATLRILEEAGPTPGSDGSPVLRIGRVATDEAARGRGVASVLMRAAVARCEERAPGAPILLGAQSHLADWYARFGFAVDGAPYAEDGIPHLPMRRPGRGS